MAGRKKVKKDNSEELNEVEDTPSETQEDVEVICPRCKEPVTPDFNNLVVAKTGLITMRCPKCGKWGALPKAEATKLINAVGEEYIDKFRKERDESELKSDDMAFEEQMEDIISTLETLMKNEKIPPMTRKEVIDWMRLLPIPTDLSEQAIQYIINTLDSLLKSYFVPDTARIKVIKRFEMMLRKEQMKKERIMQTMNIQTPPFSTSMYPTQLQSQPQYPMNIPTQQAQPQFQPFMPLQQQLNQPPFAYPQPPQQPNVYQMQQPMQQPPEHVQYVMEEDEDYEEVIEELDEKGNVKRVIRRIPRKEGSSSSIGEAIELVKALGFMSPVEVFDKMVEITRELKEEKEKEPKQPQTITEKAKELEILLKQITDMQKRMTELQEKVTEEKYQKELELKKKEFEMLKEKFDKELELLKAKQDKEIEIMKVKAELQGGIQKPAEIQELEVKKDFIREVGGDLRETMMSLMDRTIGPLVDVVRANQLMMLKLQEEAGKLPPGTVEKIVTKKPVVEKDVEPIKERLKKIKKT